MFLSYASEDRDQIRDLVAFLEDAGLSVWWDNRLLGGSMFSTEIENELTQSEAVIVVWSRHSATSRWVADEAELALRLGKLVPIQIDQTEPPLGFRQIQTIDLSQWQNDADDPIFITLLASLRAKLTNVPASIHRSATARTKAPKYSIAVLPFVNMSADPDQEYFSDGISEELLNLLAKVTQMKVTARGSTFQFKGREQDVKRVGSLLNVAHVLEGSVRKAGNRVRITAQLIESDTGYHIWSETYDRTLEDIFEIQDEISAAIVHELKERILDATEIDSPKSNRSANVDAYEHFLLGQQLLNTRTKSSIERGLSEFEKSLTFDPDYLPSLVGLAECHLLLSKHITSYGSTSIKEAQAKAWPLLQLAGKIESKNADVYSAQALYALIGDDLKNAKELSERAIAINSNSAAAHRILGFALAGLSGSTHQIIPTLQKALEVDPLSLSTLISLANEYKYRGRFAEAEALRQRCLVINPIWPGVLNGMASDAYTRGSLKIALSVFTDHESLLTSPVGLANIQLILTRLGFGQEVEYLEEYIALTLYSIYGFEDDANRLGKRLTDSLPADTDYETALTFVDWYSRIGKNKEALALLAPFVIDTDPLQGLLFSPDSDYYGAMYMYHLSLELGDVETTKVYLENLRIIHKDLISDPNGISIRAFMIGALIALADGDIEVCCDQIEQEFERNKSDTAFEYSPFFERIADYPRFKDLVGWARKNLQAEISTAKQDGLLPPSKELLQAIKE